jgi:hypothetical protein
VRNGNYCIIPVKMTEHRDPFRAAAALILVLALTIGSLSGLSGPAQTAPTQEDTAGPGPAKRTPALRKAAKDFLQDSGRIWSSPFRLKNKQVGPLVLFAATTAVLVAVDEGLHREVKSYADGHRWVGDVGPVITTLGGAGAWAAAGLFYGAGLVLKDPRARDTGYLAASAILQSFLVSHPVKGLTGRRRPLAADGQDHWSGPTGFFKRYDPDNYGLYDSFPSGHSATAFSLATVVALQYRHRAWVGIAAYSLAAAASLSRVTESRHWMSDVFVGAVLGHLVARLVVHNHAKRRRLVPAVACSGRTVVFGFHYALDPVRR